MNQFFIFIKKECYHIFRDRRTMFILLGMPIVQIIIFGFALTNEVKNAHIAVWDLSRDPVSRSLVTALDASKYFELKKEVRRYEEIEASFRKGDIKMAVIIPTGFAEDLQHTNAAQVQLIADASDPNVANTLTNYGTAIIQDFLQRLNQDKKIPFTIHAEMRMLYNPQLKGAYNFVPGVMAMVLLLVCTMMTAITIVREKEMGTMEVILVSPVKPLLLIIAKAVPYLILSIVNISSILLLSVYILDVPIHGSIALLMGVSILFILVSLSLGLLISTVAQNQQTANFISLVALFLPTVMLSGFMFPIENMPIPMQVVSNMVPAKWYYFMVKAVMIKGLGLHSIWKEVWVLNGMLIFFLTMAFKKFKMRLA